MSAKKIILYINLLRPYQWIKNILVFAPVFFSGNIFSNQIVNCIEGFISFCLASSIGYIVNDWIDRHRDLNNPIKKNRPIASKKISGLEALVLLLILNLLLCVLLYNYIHSSNFIALLCVYVVLTLSYSIYLKQIAIVEIFTVSMGFVIRVCAGGAISGIDISSWLFLTVFFISMLISTAKRKSELHAMGEYCAEKHRKSHKEYSLGFLSHLLWACGSITLVVYALYSVEKSDTIVYSVIPASYGIFRFIHLTDSGMGGDPIKTLITDKQLLIVTLLYVTMLGYIIYT